MRTIVYAAWTAILFALLACVGVAYTGYSLLTEAEVRAQTAADAEQQSSRAAFNERLRSLVNETKDARAELESLVSGDIISIVKTLEGIGDDAGVRLLVSSAVPGGAPVDLPGGSQLQPISFVLQADGSYVALTKAVSLLERVGLPAIIDEVNMEHDGRADSRGLWHLIARVKVFTTAPISS